MTRDNGSPAAPETVVLQNAVLCVDCELVTTSLGNQCPVCGGRGLLSLAAIIGGRLVDHRASHFHNRQIYLFDLHVTIDMPQMEAEDLSATIESISRAIAPKLDRDRASLHINVEPTISNAPVRLKAA